MTDFLKRISAIAKSHDDTSPLLRLHPELTTRIPVLRARSDEETGFAFGSFTEAGSFYAAHVWAHKAIKVISDNIAPLTLRIVRGSGEEAEPVDSHPLDLVLRIEPNPAQTPPDLWRAWTVDMMLGGEQGLEVVRDRNNRSRVVELWPRQPDAFYPRPGPRGRRYLDVAGYRVDDGAGDDYFLGPDEFIHFRFYNPLSPFRGIAPITAVRQSVVIDQLAQAWSQLFFRNSARPDFAVLSDEGLTARQVEDLEVKLSQRFGGYEKAHRPIVLEESVKDVKPLSYPPKDLEWIGQRELSRDEVGAIFGVPDEIMGYGRDTYENFETAVRVLWTVTLVPLIDFRDTVLTGFFRRHGLLSTEERISTDVSGVSELQEDLTEKLAQAKDFFAMGVPFNEIEKRLGLGIGDVPGGDVGYLPFSVSPVGGSRTAPAPIAASLEEPEKKLPAPLAREEEEPDPAPEWRYGRGAPSFGSPDHHSLLKQNGERIDPLVPPMVRRLKRYMQTQQIEVSRRLRNSRNFGRGKYVEALTASNGRSLLVRQGEERIPPLSEILDLEAEILRFKEEFGDDILQAIELSGELELARLGISGAFDLDRPEVRATFRFILETVARKTNESTWTDLIGIFEEAERAGEGVPAIMERLSAYYGDRKSDWQVERIARTTLTPAGEAGALEAWTQAEGVVGREWLSALMPGRTRDAHAEAHGQRVGLRELFTVWGEALLYPGDPNGRPENIINCLCTTVPVFVGEEERSYNRPAALAPVEREEESVMRGSPHLHTHVHLPEGLKLEIPAPIVNVEIPKQEPPSVVVNLPPPDAPSITIETPAPEVRIEPPAVTVEPKISVEVSLPQEETEIEVVERDPAGRAKRIRKTTKREAIEETVTDDKEGTK